jgi:C_GCAxxG_C_C family probable redox protein
MLSVGGQYIENLNDQMCRMATGFSGGIGRTHRDLCGALSAGIMVIGALRGRTSPNEDEGKCLYLVNKYRDLFDQKFNSIYCCQLRVEVYGSHNQIPCSVLVRRAANILLDLLDH